MNVIKNEKGQLIIVNEGNIPNELVSMYGFATSCSDFKVIDVVNDTVKLKASREFIGDDGVVFGEPRSAGSFSIDAPIPDVIGLDLIGITQYFVDKNVEKYAPVEEL